jgi:hypothetical protein
MSEILPNPVPAGMLAWDKMKGKIPAAVQRLNRYGNDVVRGDVIFLAELGQEEVRGILEGKNPWGQPPVKMPFHHLTGIDKGRIEADCDGDSLLIPAYAGAACDGVRGPDTIFYRDAKGPEDLDDMVWGSGGLSTVVIVDCGAEPFVLGLAYANREAAEHNFVWKRVEGPEGGRKAVPAEEGSPEAKRLMTLWSRRRGLWIKGLTSGQFMEFKGMRRTGEEYRDEFGQDALIYVVSHAPGVGFCHEKYSDLGVVGPSDGYFTSCFHRGVSL